MLILIIGSIRSYFKCEAFCERFFFQAKLFVSNEFDEGNDIVPSNVEPMNMQFKFIDRGNPLWVLSLSGDDWMAPKLRLGNTAEMEDFYNYIGPMIKSRRRRPPVRAQKDDPEKPTTKQPPRPPRSDTDIKRDFIEIINKFALSTSVAPDAYITDNTHDYDSNPFISLFIKGPYVAMIVTSKIGKISVALLHKHLVHTSELVFRETRYARKSHTNSGRSQA